jgi:hypothetical protein
MIYEFPAFAGKITHAHTVCTRPFLLPPQRKGPGYEASMKAAETTCKCVGHREEVVLGANSLD